METILEVGKKYRLSNWNDTFYAECIKIHNDKYVMMEVNEFDDLHLLVYHFSPNKDWLPYIEPVKPVEWKTFFIETMGEEVPSRFIKQYLSFDAAKEDNKTAITITEIKLNFEIV